MFKHFKVEFQLTKHHQLPPIFSFKTSFISRLYIPGCGAGVVNIYIVNPTKLQRRLNGDFNERRERGHKSCPWNPQIPPPPINCPLNVLSNPLLPPHPRTNYCPPGISWGLFVSFKFSFKISLSILHWKLDS